MDGSEGGIFALGGKWFWTWVVIVGLDVFIVCFHLGLGFFVGLFVDYFGTTFG